MSFSIRMKKDRKTLEIYGTQAISIVTEFYPKNYSLANIQKQDPEIRLYFPVKYQ